MRSGSTDPKIDSPEIQVTFGNGVTQRMVLDHYDAIPNADAIDQSRLCNYLGYLEGDEMNTVVAVTGCLMGNDSDKEMHITLLSPYSPTQKSFSLDKTGNTKHIEIEYEDDIMNVTDDRLGQSGSVISESRKLSDWREFGGDSFINDKLEKAAKRVSEKELRGVPKTLTLNFRLVYDKGVKDHFEGDTKKVNNWLAEVMTHVQSHYMHSSLQHKIIFKVKQRDNFQILLCY